MELPPEAAPLVRYGLTPAWLARAEAAGGTLATLGRVSTETRRQWTVETVRGPVLASVRSGRSALGEGQKPTVGDYVLLEEEPEGPPVIRALLERQTVLRRRAAGKVIREQIACANLDSALIVSPIGAELSLPRLERFVALALDGGIEPLLVLNKADQHPAPEERVAEVQRAFPGRPVFAVSAMDGRGLAPLSEVLQPGRSLVLLGTSGAGKSTLINRWLGAEAQETQTVREDGKGRHTTTSRQLFVLPGGALVIDTPGVREVGLWTSGQGLSSLFSDLLQHAADCRFADCAHENEPGCAIRAAVEDGTIPAERYQTWLKLELERQATSERDHERRSRERVASKGLRKRLKQKRSLPDDGD